jgi:hypothetical protein
MFAVSMSYFFLYAMNLHAYSIKCLGIPAFCATVLACKTICPFCMPSTANALNAAKFCPKPTAAKI